MRESETDRQTVTGRQAGRQADKRQTERQTERKRVEMRMTTESILDGGVVFGGSCTLLMELSNQKQKKTGTSIFR